MSIPLCSRAPTSASPARGPVARPVAARMAYADTMPRLPLRSTGLAPLLQGLLLPSLVVWLVRRKIR